ncbi:class I fructose-bisphosphate aldolase [Pedobacter gandavensis]|uniref:class I fructose-bisphosphate aldolase n=1 Tax=Pedobacter gandavensis TaxID=2679963 RepID=UPI002478C369|nr:class I fructose-bisphosphate aldolase [Pedobacter gandavensis]WGQ09850.1 class I fructose-bisphosphate aldolase [Pedobacter gandavensis]
MNYHQITALIGENESLFSHRCETITKENLHLPGADFIDRIYINSTRNIQTLRSLNSIYNSGRLSGTGYLSILPVDQGVEHSAGASFSSNPIYFDPENIVRLAIEGGCNAVASTIGGLAAVARKYAHKIPFIIKLNHNELLTYPNKYDQVMFTSVKNAWNSGAAAVGATIYFGSSASNEQLIAVSQAFEQAHQLGMATVLWCYLRNDHFVQDDIDYHTAADLTGQANYLGVTIQADLIKQKLPELNGGYKALCRYGTKYGKYTEEMYTQLTTVHPIDLCRYQVMNCFMGRAGLINSGGASTGKDDLKEALRTAVINKRADGMGLITGRKSFQKPFHEGVALLHAVQDVYLEQKIDIA